MLFQLLWILSETEIVRLLRSAKKNTDRMKKKDVWLLFSRVMSYPDFVYRAVLFMRVRMVCMESL